jgi:hypothetical protein
MCQSVLLESLMRQVSAIWLQSIFGSGGLDGEGTQRRGRLVHGCWTCTLSIRQYDLLPIPLITLTLLPHLAFPSQDISKYNHPAGLFRDPYVISGFAFHSSSLL